MFPNPQDALPLPPHPSGERYKKIAKELVKACKSGEPGSVHSWAERWVESLVELSGLVITPELPVRAQRWTDAVAEFARRTLPGSGKECSVTKAQFVIARSHGFDSWPKFSKHLQALARDASPESRFEAAADAIVRGDIAAVKRLLRDEPGLVRARSRREHRATLLHYVSANGVEGYRQKTPQNIVEIAETLLEAGAEVDATANVYGGGCTTLGLTATSIHPERARVQEALLQTLLDHGAALDRSIVNACLANARLKAAEFLAGRGAHLDLAAAAGLGRLDLVQSFFTRHENVTQEQLRNAFLYACGYGRNRVVEFLVTKGADTAIADSQGQTGLHHAVIGGHPETVKLLLGHNAPLEAENRYGGTVLGQALWSAAHGGDPQVYIAILETLIAAGAQIPERHVPVNPQIDEWLARHGSRAEPTWRWHGEG